MEWSKAMIPSVYTSPGRSQQIRTLVLSSVLLHGALLAVGHA
jgi:hypothetical protein